MAIAFSASSSASGATVGSLTWAHTISGTQRLLLVGIQVNSAQVPTCTYNGVSMSRLDTTTPSGNIYLFYLFTPDTGTHNIVATFNNPTTPQAVAVAASYTGVAGPSLDASNTASASSATTCTANITTVTNNAWTMCVGYADNGNTPGAGGSTTSRVAISYIGMFDSNAPVTPAGATSLAFTSSGATSLRGIIVAIKTAVSAPTTTSSSTTSTSTSTTTTTSSTTSSSTTTPAPPPDVQETGTPVVYVRN